MKLPSAAWLTALVDRCAGLEEQPGTLDVAVLARNEQRRDAAIRRLVDRRNG